MGKASRDKGAAWEREVAKMLRAAGVPAKRGLGQARSASEVADVQVEGYWVECKVGGPAKYPLRALAQATKAMLEAVALDTEPVAICKVDRREPTATMRVPVRGVIVTATMSIADFIEIARAKNGVA